MNEEAPKKPAWRRWPLLVVLGVLIAVVVVVVVASLLTGSGEEPAADARPRPELDPLTLSERVWAADRLTLFFNGGSLRLRDGVLLGKTADGLQLLDVESGAKRWSQDQFADLPGQTVGYDSGAHPQLPPLVGHGGGLGVLVGYQEFDNCGLVEPGVALLSAETGGVVWQAPTMPAECGGWTQNVWAADDATAVVSVEPSGGDLDDARQVRILALDVATGQRKWEHQGGWPYGVVGGVALVSAKNPMRSASATKPGTVSALDLTTGQPRWSLADRYPVAHVMLVVGDLVVVLTSDGSAEGRTVRVLDAATGRELGALPDVEPGTCVADATLVACQADPLRGGPRLVTFRAADRAVTTAAIEEHTTLEYVVQGRISVAVFGRREPLVVTIDRTGNVIDEKPPGALLAIADDLAFVRVTRDEEDFLAVYRVTG